MVGVGGDHDPAAVRGYLGADRGQLEVDLEDPVAAWVCKEIWEDRADQVKEALSLLLDQALGVHHGDPGKVDYLRGWEWE